MPWSGYILFGFLFASFFFLLAAGALFWAHRNGQLNNLEDGANSIFTKRNLLVRFQIISRGNQPIPLSANKYLSLS